MKLSGTSTAVRVRVNPYLGMPMVLEYHTSTGTITLREVIESRVGR